jgi:glycosyltransferase involved in cell wall biosynthesis
MKQKILLAADTYYPKVDGTLRFMEEFIQRASDFEISLLVPNLGKNHKMKVHKTTFLEPSKRIKLSGYPSLKFSLKNFKKIKEAIKESEIVFVQGPALISYLSIYYGKKYKKKVVFYMHVIAWELFAKFLPPLVNKLFFKIIKRGSIYFYNKCDLILVPYRALEINLKSEGVKTKMEIAKLGVNINMFSPSSDKAKSKEKIGINPNKKVIGYVGRISKEKNVEIILEAFRKLKDQQNHHLLIVGDGPEEQKKKFHEIPNCTITGFVKDVEKYLQAMDVFVMASLTETTSLATLEAMSCGLPVIASKVGFIKNYISKNHNGLFFARNSSSMLAIKIEKILHDSSLSKKLGNNARKTVAYSFSWERSINRIKRLLISIFYD